MNSHHIRVVALCVFHRSGQILVNESFDSHKRASFYRPLGGGIEFGETSAEAIKREISEELGAAITNLKLLGAIENIFSFEGKQGHEFIQIFDAEFLDPELYTKGFIQGKESDGMPIRAAWHGLGTFSETKPLYPDGLLDLLSTKLI
jgi:8-oxo-dGTP pyrophosphatase MutT (NUDIX family)